MMAVEIVFFRAVTSLKYVLFVLIFGTSLMWHIIEAKSLSGRDMTCDNEGELVDVSLLQGDPCFSCFCRNGRVECEDRHCPSLQGCQAVLFSRPAGACCDVCKGCTVNGEAMPSGLTWPDRRDPCVVHSCMAGVSTTSRVLCRPPCENPFFVPGQCCPVCTGCSFEGEDYMSGEVFRSKEEPSIECTCKAGNIDCSKRVCPVVNCPTELLHNLPGDPCPSCKGSRVIFDIRDHCYFAKKVYGHGDVLVLDHCTSCVCQHGTMSCERQQCPKVTCPLKDQALIPGQCCPVCKRNKPCQVGLDHIPHGQSWESNQCTVCKCHEGESRCTQKTCNGAPSYCPLGLKLVYNKQTCCAECVQEKAKCTVKGVHSQRVTTFDGYRYNMQGTCVHELLRDCSENIFAVRIHYANDVNRLQRKRSRRSTQIEGKSDNGGILYNESIMNLTLDPFDELDIDKKTMSEDKRNDIKLVGSASKSNTESLDSTLINPKANGNSEVGQNQNFFGEVRRPKVISKVTIRYAATRIQLDRTFKIRVNHSSIRHSSFVQDRTFSMRVKPPRIYVTLKNGVKVVWNTRDVLTIKAAPNVQGMCALCGNMNGKADDDMRNKLGDIVSNSDKFVESWTRNKKCRRSSSTKNKRLRADGNGADSVEISEIEATAPTTTTTKRPGVVHGAVQSEEVGLDIGLSSCPLNSVHWIKVREDCQRSRNTWLQKCRGVVDVEAFMSSCIREVCGCHGDKDCEIKNLNTHAVDCYKSYELRLP